MNKKQKIIFFFFVLLLLFGLSFLFYQNKQKLPGVQKGVNEEQQNLDQSPAYTPTAREASNWNAPFTKQIQVVFATEEELEQMGINVSPLFDPARIQVLERDENGRVITYKKIYNDNEIIHELYLPTGSLSEGGIVPIIEESEENI
jgi:hypothetical protein